MPWIQSRRVRVGVGVAIAVALLGLAALATPAHSQDWPDRFVVGATITQPQKEAPIFINTVWAESPAGRAGITSGSRLLAIDGVQVIDLHEAAKHMSSDRVGSVTLPRKAAAIQHPVVAPQHPVAINELGDLATKGTGLTIRLPADSAWKMSFSSAMLLAPGAIPGIVAQKWFFSGSPEFGHSA